MIFRRFSTALAVLALLGSAGCESSGESGPGQSGSNESVGPACGADADCVSGNCDSGRCSGGGGLVGGADCSSDSDCASGDCSGGTCTDAPASGAGGDGTGSSSNGGNSSGGGNNGGGTPMSSSFGDTPAGGDCTVGSDCQSGACVDGTCEAMMSTGQTVTTTAGPHFMGSGSGFRPLTTGCGPETATECTGTCEGMGGDPEVNVVRAPATLCFQGDGDATPEDPSVVIEQVIEELNGVQYVHLRVTFDPSFTDSTYGEGACCGWPQKRGHTFSDLSKSDHTELLLTNADGDTVMQFKIDLITEDATAACGATTLGVSGGDGAVLEGSEEYVLAVATSLDRNLNGCDYCDLDACGGDCTVNSPGTDEEYTPNAEAPNWDYRQVYEVWIDLDAFGDIGFGQAFMTYVHSSPSKEGTPDTIDVEPTPCPPDWDTPYCPPDVIQEGRNCFPGYPPPGENPPSDGGAPPPSDGGAPPPPSGPPPPSCPPNSQICRDGEPCTPIPFANYENMAACPPGYQLDLISEGQCCAPM